MDPHQTLVRGLEPVRGVASNRSAEPFCTIREAGERLNLHHWLLLRAVRNGDVPAYTLGNSRKRVRLSEVVEAIAASRQQPSARDQMTPRT